MSLELIINNVLKVTGARQMENTLRAARDLGVQVSRVDEKFKKLSKTIENGFSGNRGYSFGPNTKVFSHIKQATLRFNKLSEEQARALKRFRQNGQTGFSSSRYLKETGNGAGGADGTFHGGIHGFIGDIHAKQGADALKLAQLFKERGDKAKTGKLKSDITYAKAYEDIQKMIAVTDRLKAHERSQLNAQTILAQKAFDESRQHAQSYFRALERGDTEEARRSAMMYNELIRRSRAYANEVTRDASKIIRANERVSNSHKNIIHQLVGIRHTMWSLAALFGAEKAMGWGESLAHTTFEAFKHLIEYNDELERSKTVFAGLAIVHTGKSQAAITLFGSDQEKKDLARAKNFSKKMVDIVRITSAKTGQPFEQLMDSAKSILPDVMNKIHVGKGKNPLLENQDKIIGMTKDFLELGSVLKMIDPAGHAVKWHTYALREIMRGTGGGKNDTGMSLMKSLRTREGINPTRAEATTIAKLVNGGKVFDAVTEIKKLLRRSGISGDKITDLQLQTLQPNIDGVKTMLNVLGGVATKPAYDKILSFFSALNTYLVDLSQNKAFMAKLSNWGKELGGIVDQNLSKFSDWIDAIGSGKADKGINQLIEGLKGASTAGQALVEDLGAFMSGFLKKDPGKTFKDMTGYLKDMKSPAHDLGVEFRSIADSLAAISKALKPIAWILNHSLVPVLDLDTALRGDKIRIPGLSGNTYDEAMARAQASMKQQDSSFNHWIVDNKNNPTAMRSMNVTPAEIRAAEAAVKKEYGGKGAGTQLNFYAPVTVKTDHIDTLAEEIKKKYHLKEQKHQNSIMIR